MRLDELNRAYNKLRAENKALKKSVEEIEDENRTLRDRCVVAEQSRDELLDALKQLDDQEMVYVNGKNLSVGEVIEIAEAL